MQAVRVRALPVRRVISTAGPMSFGLFFAYLLVDKLRGLDMSEVTGAIHAVAPAQWLAAIGFTILSFWAIGRYDEVIHRHLGTGISGRDARRSGAASIALAQVLGLGVVTGAVARWRMVPGLSALDAARVSGAVAVSFTAAWAVVAAATDLFLPLDVLPPGVAPLVLLGGAVFIGLTAFRSGVRIFGRPVRMLPLRAIGAILLFTALDTMAAALALHALMPAGTAPGVAIILPAFLIALGMALLSSTPGGVGPLEFTLLALLPTVPQADLVAAIVAFRLVYYALPACIALTALARPFRTAGAGPGYRLDAVPPATVSDEARAELGVTRQNGAGTLAAHGSEGAVIETPQTLTLLFAASRGPLAPLLPALEEAARACNRGACAYKISASDAATARDAGWHVAHIADEAVIDPSSFTTDGPAHRQLRRKLRHASKAGVVIRHAPHPDAASMTRVDAIWRARHDGARGVTMGRFTPGYVAGQRVYCAELEGRLIAFISLHTGPREWTLDLMRHGDELPDGTMHSLIRAALTDARHAGIPRVSLAAMPVQEGPEARAVAWVRRRITTRSGCAGRARFKATFAPRLEPLYAAAPTRLGLALALLDLAVAIRRPPPLGPAEDCQGPAVVTHHEGAPA